MSKITGSFLALVFVIVFSSIIYIWKADGEKRTLESQIQTQEEQIASLESQLDQQTSPATTINTGEVQGITTATGTLTGSVTVSTPTEAEAIIVCTKEIRSLQETCTDFIFESTKKVYEFTFEIPQGTYEVYAMLPPSETKVYYSDISACDELGDCTSNAEKKRLLQVKLDETQSDVSISL